MTGLKPCSSSYNCPSPDFIGSITYSRFIVSRRPVSQRPITTTITPTYNLKSSAFISEGGGVSGAHSDIAKPEVAHVFWAAVMTV